MYEAGLLIYAAAIVLSCYLIQDAFKHRFLPIAQPLMCMSVVLALICCIDLVKLIDPAINRSLAQALYDIDFLFLQPLIIPFWTWIILEYHYDKKIKLANKITLLFFIQPTIVWVIVLTHIVMNGFLDPTSTTGLIDPRERLGDYILVRIIYTFIVITSLSLLTPYLVKKHRQRSLGDLSLVTFAIAAPYALYLLNFSGFISLQLGVPAFVFFVFLGSRQYRLLDVMPIALRGIMNQVDSGVLVGSPRAKLLYINEHAKTLFNLTITEQALQRREFDMPAMFQQQFDFSRPEKQTVLMQAENPENSVEIRYIDATLQPIFSPQQAQHLGSSISFHDITERKQAELELQNFNRQKSEFFAGISHEFRTPLTLSLGNIKDVLHDLPTAKPDQLKPLLLQAQSNNERLLSLVNQLLELSRLDRGALNIKPVPLQLADHLPMLIANFESLAEKQNIQLHFTTNQSEQDTTVYFDPDALDKVVLNLISNALKSMADMDGGTVQIELDTTDAECLPLTVRDIGCGIPAEALSKIFEMFYSNQLDNTVWPRGTGVGLSLVKQLLLLHHATISVDSVVGSGSCFTVRFRRGYAHFADDIAVSHEALQTVGSMATVDYALYAPEHIDDTKPDDAQAIIKHPSSTQPRGTKKLILLAEDNPDMRRYISKHLMDFRVVEAADGEAALALVQQLMPDLILSDVMMPKMNGYDLCKSLKADTQTSHIPVVLLTAKSAQTERLEGLSLGADDYLSKPFDARELKLRINNLINSRVAIHAFYQANGLAEVIKHPDLPPSETGFLEKMQQYIRKHLADPDIRIADLAAVANMSERSLSRKVKMLTGDTPKQMLLIVRLEQAAKQLIRSADSITAVSIDMGFSDASHFTRSFKKHYGMTPSQYRERRPV